MLLMLYLKKDSNDPKNKQITLLNFEHTQLKSLKSLSGNIASREMNENRTDSKRFTRFCRLLTCVFACPWQYTVEICRIHVLSKRNVRKQNRFTAVYPILYNGHLFSLRTKTKKIFGNSSLRIHGLPKRNV